MNWFKNLNATPRLMSSFAVLLVLTIVVSYLAITNLSQANDRLQDLYQKDMTGAIKANAMAVDRGLVGLTLRDAMLHVNDAAKVAEDEKQTNASLTALQSDIDAAEKLFTTPAGRETMLALHNAFPAYESGVHQVYERIKAKDAAGSEAGLVSLMMVAKPLAENAYRAIDLKVKLAEEKFQANNASYQSARSLLLGACLVSLILGVILSIVIARGFAIPLGMAVATLEKVAEGDMTATLDVHTQDEVGRMAEALNRTVEKLNNTLQEVTDSATNASSSSQQLAAAAESIASGAQEQAASLEETSASLEEITAAVRQSADNANQASQLAAGSKDSALQGQNVVSDAVTAMAEINAASAKIKDIIGTIDEIAFQTNLLAVNAAVEAARAGDEGRGFAVVASEVRSLAQRSAVAAKEIKGLIQDSLKKVDAGSGLVNRSGETLHGIVGSVKRVTDIVGEIAAASGEQSTGIEQVNTALTQMDQVTQANSAQTEELSATAQALSEQAAHLMELVSTFKLGYRGEDRRGRQVFTPRPAATGSLTAGSSAKASAGHSAPRPSPKPHANLTASHAAKAARSTAPAKPAPSSHGDEEANATPPAMVMAPPNGSGGSDSSFVEF